VDKTILNGIYWVGHRNALVGVKFDGTAAYY